MGTLNDQQFAENIDEYGGASRHVLTQTDYDDGVFVSRHPHLPVSAGGSDERTYPGSLTQAQMTRLVHQHLSRNAQDAITATPEERRDDVVQGAWKKETGDRVIDISDRYPETVEGYQKAEESAAHNLQEEGYALGSDTSLPMWSKVPGTPLTTASNSAWRSAMQEQFGVQTPRRGGIRNANTGEEVHFQGEGGLTTPDPGPEVMWKPND